MQHLVVDDHWIQVGLNEIIKGDVFVGHFGASGHVGVVLTFRCKDCERWTGNSSLQKVSEGRDGRRLLPEFIENAANSARERQSNRPFAANVCGIPVHPS